MPRTLFPANQKFDNYRICRYKGLDRQRRRDTPMKTPKHTLALAALPLLLAGCQPETIVDICSRTPQVEEAILDEIEAHTGGRPHCGETTDRDLLAVGALRLAGNYPVDEIRMEDFEGLANLKVLSLADNGLRGEIPGALGALANLERLYLWGNNLSGPIPPELGDLSNLEGLYLWGNELSGPIPPELGRLANLEGLYLQDNNLSGPIPPELGDLANLEVLGLSSNSLNGPVPPELGRLANLEVLDLLEQRFERPDPSRVGQSHQPKVSLTSGTTI